MEGEEAETRGSPSGKDGGFLSCGTGPSDAHIDGLVDAGLDA